MNELRLIIRVKVELWIVIVKKAWVTKEWVIGGIVEAEPWLWEIVAGMRDVKMSEEFAASY